MITTTNPRFFNIFCGTNSGLYESFIMLMYEEMHRGIMGETIMNKSYMRSVAIKAIKNHEEENPSVMDGDILARTMLENVEMNGWVENKYDSFNLEFVYNLTRDGRKVAQAIYQINKKDSITRHRNVRTTLGLLESYKRDGDPYDLIDALDASDHIVSDLMDLINEIHEKRKELTKDAAESLEFAGESFLQYIEEEFIPSMDAYFNKDSLSKNSIRVDDIINGVLDSTKQIDLYTKKMIERYPSMQNKEAPVEEMLITISDRVKNAKNNKLPELATATNNLLRHSEMVLRQVGSLRVKRSSKVSILALSIQEMSKERRDMTMASICKKMSFSKARYFDPYKIKIKAINKARKINSSVLAQEEASDEVKKEQEILRLIVESKICLTDDVERKIAELLTHNENIINGQVPIQSYKDFSASMQLVSIASQMNEYQVRRSNVPCVNEYFRTDECIISKKDSE